MTGRTAGAFVMNIEDRKAIQGLFARMEDVGRNGTARDPEAEAYIQARIDAQPGAAYYLAQTVLMQEQALKAAEAKMASGGFNPGQGAANAAPSGSLEESGGYFGRTPPRGTITSAAGASAFNDGRSPSQTLTPSGQPLGSAPPAGSNMAPAQAAAPGRGGGFLAGAAQTAMGVAGGMMLGNLLGGLFGGHGANANTSDAAKPDALADSSDGNDAGGNDATANDGNDTWDWGGGNKDQVAADDTSNDDFGSGFFDDGGSDYDEV
jgi:hypothetical protein